MNHINRLFAVAMLAVLSCCWSGCAYMKVRTPMDRDFNNTEIGALRGESHSRSVLYLVSWGDGGAKAAAENGGIKVIKYADQEVFCILFGAYTRVTTIVYGD